MRVSLSPKQREIVEATEGAQLVLASAGSGKTRILTERIRHLLENRTTHFKVLGLTFTNKAADEMRERLADLLDLADNAYIGTIHSFCQMVIESHGHTIGLKRAPVIMERESDRLALLEEVLLGNAALAPYYRQLGNERERRQQLYNLLTFFSRRKRQLTGSISQADVQWSSAEAEMAYRDYNDRLAGQGAIDFDDILLVAYRILTEHPQVARLYTRTYRYVCVDEAQDLNEAQYALIRVLASGNGNVLMVGDPNQAIYGFTGSDRRFMLESFTQDFPVCPYELKENYRSSKAVIRAANSLFPDSMDEELAPLNGLCEVRSLPTEDDEAQWVAGKIEELLAVRRHADIEGDISLSRMVVLARNRYVFPPLRERLGAKGIPHYLKRVGSTGELESDFGQAFDLGLRLLINDLDRLHLGQLCELLGIAGDPDDNSQRGLAKLCALAQRTDSHWSKDYDALLAAWSVLDNDVNDFPQALARLREHCSAVVGDNPDATSGRALTLLDLAYLHETWRKYALQVAADRRSLGHFRNQMAMGLTTPHEEQSGLALATVHSVKGVEYDIVFVIGMVEGTFPDYRATRTQGKALDEEKNEAFVAMTRAKRLLFMTWPESKFMPWDQSKRAPQQRSRFLSGIAAYTVNEQPRQLRVAEGPQT
jgi:DNA helicase II / ATP-dependent DNA helicase PcrA